MDIQQRSKLKEKYSLVPDEELIDMAREGSQSYAEGAYGLLLDEIKKRGIEEGMEGIKSVPAEPEKSGLTNDEAKVDTFAELAVIINQQEKDSLGSALGAAGIPFYFQSLNIRGKDWPVALMVEQSRVEDAVELLKNFKPDGGIILW